MPEPVPALDDGECKLAQVKRSGDILSSGHDDSALGAINGIAAFPASKL